MANCWVVSDYLVHCYGGSLSNQHQPVLENILKKEMVEMQMEWVKIVERGFCSTLRDAIMWEAMFLTEHQQRDGQRNARVVTEIVMPSGQGYNVTLEYEERMPVMLNIAPPLVQISA